MRRDTDIREYLPAARRGTEATVWPTVGDLFQSFFVPSFLGSNTGVSMPAIDLTEKADNYNVVVDVPGYTLDQINVQLADNVLTLAGERPELVTEATQGTKNGDNGRCHIVERATGSFSRSIKFPVPVDPAAVKAGMKNGVLTVTVPKGAAARAQRIKITEA
jgi:HSP20 family protein